MVFLPRTETLAYLLLMPSNDPATDTLSLEYTAIQWTGHWPTLSTTRFCFSFLPFFSSSSPSPLPPDDIRSNPFVAALSLCVPLSGVSSSSSPRRCTGWLWTLHIFSSPPFFVSDSPSPGFSSFSSSILNWPDSDKKLQRPAVHDGYPPISGILFFCTFDASPGVLSPDRNSSHPSPRSELCFRALAFPAVASQDFFLRLQSSVL